MKKGKKRWKNLLAASSLLLITLVTGFSEQAEADGRTAAQEGKWNRLTGGLSLLKRGTVSLSAGGFWEPSRLLFHLMCIETERS